jgi:hypothetical protein
MLAIVVESGEGDGVEVGKGQIDDDDHVDDDSSGFNTMLIASNDLQRYTLCVETRGVK